jgi:hypothetical protein
VLVALSDVGHAATPEYNSAGRDAYGNTAAQNEAMRLRGVQEKARFVGQASPKEGDNEMQILSLTFGVGLLSALVLIGVVVLRRRG